MSLDVAVDNSVLGDLTDPNLPENKKADLLAFKEMIELARQGIIEIGLPISSTMIEERHAGAEKRRLLREIMGDVLKLWPVVTAQTERDMERKKKCLREIMQDKEGIDSANLLASTIYTPYYITTDYKYCRQFKAQLKRIRDDCGLNVFVLTPSEFLKKYKSGTL